MDSQQFKQLEALFDQAVALSGEALQTFLAQVENDQPALASRLRAMLAGDQETADPVRQLIEDGVVQESAGPDRIGPFEVIRKLGAGGMGTVYLCRRSDGDFEQRVAVKRLSSSVDSAFGQQRFRLERKLLANLRHANIAHLIDGGEDDQGMPWVAMEYVEGQSITEHVASAKLDHSECVRLFLPLCDAVQFAHLNLIIHRDIKSSNVLINSQGQLKLLDFGIAKLMDRDADNEDAITVASSMTPHYASPEQVRGDPINQASDIYSMGVLLYEMLAGRRPYELNTRRPSEVERIVCETEPAKLLGRNADDLNGILAKAMHKEASRRYASAAEFGQDLERWLGGFPVSARPDSSMYRINRWIRRHPFGASATAFIAILIVGFGSLMAWQAHLLAIERDAAAREALVATETADFLIDVFAVSDPRVSNPKDVRASELLDRAAELIPLEMESDPLARAQLMHVMGLAYANLGDDKRGVDLLEQSLAIRLEESGENSPLVADSRNRLGNVLRRFGRLQEAEPLLVESLRWREANGPVDYDLADSFNNVGLLQNDVGNYEQAIQTLTRAIELHRQSDGADTLNVAAPLHNLALAHRRLSQFDLAAQSAEESLAIKQAAGDWSLSSIAVTMAVLSNIERQRGNLEQSLGYSEESLALREQVFGRDNVMIASGLSTHARILIELGQLEQAEALMREALGLHRADGSIDSLRASYHFLGLGRLLMSQGRFGEAREVLDRALQNAEQELPPGPELSMFQEALIQLAEAQESV